MYIYIRQLQNKLIERLQSKIKWYKQTQQNLPKIRWVFKQSLKEQIKSHTKSLYSPKLNPKSHTKICNDPAITMWKLFALGPIPLMVLFSPKAHSSEGKCLYTLRDVIPYKHIPVCFPKWYGSPTNFILKMQIWL